MRQQETVTRSKRYQRAWEIGAALTFLVALAGVVVPLAHRRYLELSLARALDQHDLKQAKELLRQGAGVNVRGNKYHLSSLQLACERSDVETVEWLLQRGANPNILDNTDGTPIIIASQTGPLRIVQLLIQAGARVNVHDCKGITPLQCTGCEGRTEITKLLLAQGADLNAADAYGSTGLTEAARGGYTATVKLLLDTGANPMRMSSAEGTIPLHLAAGCRQGAPTLRLLLDRGVPVDARTSYGCTALMLAVNAGLIKNVRFLLSRGANVRLRDSGDWSVLDYAKYKKAAPIIRMLERHGAL